MERKENTYFFHSYCRAKNMRMRIHKIQNSLGQWLKEEGDIAQGVVDFFQKLYSASDCDSDNEDILSHVPSLLSSNDNLDLDRLSSLGEVKGTIFSLYKNNAPGSDGFSGAFFQHC